MCIMEKETEIKKVMRSLCLSNGWSYGVFWRFDQRNSMLLTLEDAYCEEYARSVTDNMLLQVHMLGEGVIGQAALDGKHRWVSLDSSTGKCSLTGHGRIQEDNSDFTSEFSFGIKTIAVIPTDSCGVLQFGSVHKILEAPRFVDQTRQIFREMGIIDGLVPSGDATSSLISGNMDHSGQFAPLMASYNSASEVQHNVSSWSDSIPDTIPSSSYVDDHGDFFDFDPMSLHGGSVDNPCLDSLFHEPSHIHGFDELGSTEFPTSLLHLQEQHMDDNIHQCFYSLSEQCATVSEPTLNDDLLQSLIADLPSVSSQDCVTHLSGKYSDLPSSNANQLSHGFDRMHFGNVKREQTLEDVVSAPMVNNKNSGSIECVPEATGGSTMLPKKGLFSELGLDQLLSNRADCSSFAKSSVEDPICAAKKRRLECFAANGKQTSHPDKSFMMKSQGSLWASKSFTADAKSCITDQSKRPEESSKVTKKRARPGESTRPRPKDRQMIQDRIKELREIIPNGAKCSIDSLLDRTIKHMLFMQGVTKYVDKLKRVDEAKAQRDISNKGGISGSAAWAIDVGGQNPIIVEDLGHSGQMLVEMICEQHGFFLEIADVIRGFGLTILKGVVEARDDKIWAHFIVEANRHVTRMEVLMSLLQLLKDTANGGLKSVADGNKVIGNKTTSPLSNYHHQPIMSLPIGLADTLR